MVSSLEKLSEMLHEYNLTHADLEFILNFMENENISPQLAMRRIKAFETLKEKLEDNKDKEKVVMLEDELKQVKNQLMETRSELQELQQQKMGLESEKEELETKSELLDSEREELQHQLELIKNMQFDEEVEEEDKLETILNQLDEFQSHLQHVIESKKEYKPIITPLLSSIQKIKEGNKADFDESQYLQKITQIISTQEKEKKEKKTVEPPKKEIKSKQDQALKIPEIDKSEKKDRDKATKDKDKKEKVKDSKKVEEEDSDKKVTEKEEQVLNLFLEFVDEADTDKSFKDRVSTICDMDEAYEYLGSIGLSQVYSFASRGIDKKEELMQLLQSWKKEGIPR